MCVARLFLQQKKTCLWIPLSKSASFSFVISFLLPHSFLFWPFQLPFVHPFDLWCACVAIEDTLRQVGLLPATHFRARSEPVTDTWGFSGWITSHLFLSFILTFSLLWVVWLITGSFFVLYSVNTSRLSGKHAAALFHSAARTSCITFAVWSQFLTCNVCPFTPLTVDMIVKCICGSLEASPLATLVLFPTACVRVCLFWLIGIFLFCWACPPTHLIGTHVFATWWGLMSQHGHTHWCLWIAFYISLTCPWSRCKHKHV